MECEGDFTVQGWRKHDGFWGNVALQCGYPNTDYMRRALYMIWHKNSGNIKEKFDNRGRVAPTTEETLDEVSSGFKVCFHASTFLLQSYAPVACLFIIMSAFTIFIILHVFFSISIH